MCHERASRFLHNTLNVYIIINDSVSVYTYFKKERKKRKRNNVE